jgi:SAM-dependent methyltransferase
VHLDRDRHRRGARDPTAVRRARARARRRLADAQGAGGIDPATANRLFYAERAEVYDACEDCVVDPDSRAVIRWLLTSAVEFVGPNAKALDACGGSGYASALLLELGALPVTVDISAEMLARWREKAERAGYDAPTFEAEIATFLTENTESWDLIVFSSALHHLEDYLRVVGLAADRLRPGGALVTVFDPIAAGKIVRVIRHVDHLVAVLISHPREFLSKVLALGRRSATGATHVGYLAEYHARRGLDDRAIRTELEAHGFEMMVHERVYGARLRPFRALLRAIRSPSSFRMLARKAADYPRR